MDASIYIHKRAVDIEEKKLHGSVIERRKRRGLLRLGDPSTMGVFGHRQWSGERTVRKNPASVSPIERRAAAESSLRTGNRLRRLGTSKRENGVQGARIDCLLYQTSVR